MATRLIILLFSILLAPSCAQEGTSAQDRTTMPRADQILPGRAKAMPLTRKHLVFGTPLDARPPGSEVAVFSMGCFWGAEQHFFHVPGVLSTAVGYAGGTTPNPTYDEVSTGRTGHAESVRVVFDPAKISYEELLHVFWEGHDPTEGMRQGNDVGTEYRSQIVTLNDQQRRAAEATRDAYAAALRAAGRGKITTEIVAGQPFYFAETEHQQYCEANPLGYCNHGGTGVRFPTSVAAHR
ncbi:MAG TPA: peptide-methionine (S)-S-oxide reductase MsrA [Kofleriaceae bacterium]|nr:peptide-methionine (S)-S-oxide reductase MsrA [Kofleriaceae bacterium]